MNYIQSKLITFTAGILLWISSTPILAFGESFNNQKTNQHKPLKVERDIVYSRDMTHVLIGARIITQFSPRDSQGSKIELNELASKLGYEHFNWVNYVEKDPYGISDRSGARMFVPYNDPPVGGYQYDRADNFPFYWDVVNCDRCNKRHHFQNHNNLQQFNLVFEDAPADYRLQPGEAVEFLTSLVGVKSINIHKNESKWEILHAFRWKLTNPRPDYSQVSLVNTNVDLEQLSPSLVSVMLLDGAAMPTYTEVFGSN